MIVNKSVFVKAAVLRLEPCHLIISLFCFQFPRDFEARCAFNNKVSSLFISYPAVALAFLLEEYLIFDLARYGFGKYVVEVYIAQPLFIKDRLSYISEERRRCFVAE